MEILAKRLKWLREKERYSQSEIARKIGMTPSGYQKIEYSQRDPNLDVLVKLCDIFEVSSDFLLGRRNDVKELRRIKMEIEQIEIKISYYKEKSTVNMYQVKNIREQMIKCANELGFAHEMTIKYSQELDNRIADHSEIIATIEELQREKNEIILNYIVQFLSIPVPESFHDDVIMLYYPFKISIQMNLFDEFELMLYGRDIGLIGTIEIYKNENEAVEAEKRILSILNGNGK